MSVLLIILVVAHTLSEGIVGGKPIKTERVLLDDDKMREYLVWFRFFDNDKDAQLQDKQFKEILWVLGRIPRFDEQPEFERILEVVDPKRNGFITRQTFMAYLVNEHLGRGTYEAQQQMYEQHIDELLRHMELHGDGVQMHLEPNCSSKPTTETKTAPMTNDGTHKGL
ncbi:hypothetical protein niasHT_016570 [Heterodera trifolii]|uniref:EF-hand domain-containing protein n=1 Tax=Heterodera trifolii TaxID=157864 RepID=A0ABD2LB61_9BILA